MARVVGGGLGARWYKGGGVGLTREMRVDLVLLMKRVTSWK